MQFDCSDAVTARAGVRWNRTQVYPSVEARSVQMRHVAYAFIGSQPPRGLWRQRRPDLSIRLYPRCTLLSSAICCSGAAEGGPLADPKFQQRPADIYLPIWKRGQPAALDVTCIISTMQQLTQASAASTPGYALYVGEERKMAAHAEACRSVGVYFVPIVAETLGGWSELAIDTIKSIGRLQGQRLSIPPPNSTRHLFQRLAISLWKGNATLLIRRQPTRPAAVDGIVLLNLFLLILLFIYLFIVFRWCFLYSTVFSVLYSIHCIVLYSLFTICATTQRYATRGLASYCEPGFKQTCNGEYTKHCTRSRHQLKMAAPK